MYDSIIDLILLSLLDYLCNSYLHFYHVLYNLKSLMNVFCQMENHSFSILTFQWKPVHDEKKILEVNPPFGELG